MAKAIKTIVIAVAFCSACSRANFDEAATSIRADASAKEEVLNCYQHGDPPGEYCRASIIRMLSEPAIFNGKNVIVYGYLAEVEGAYYLFASHDFFLSRDLSSAFALTSGKGEVTGFAGFNDSNVTVFGVMSPEVPSLSVLLEPAGTLHVTKLRNGFNH